MMTNLFSTFDPSSSLWLSSNWYSSPLILVFAPSYFWLTKTKPSVLVETAKLTLHKEFTLLLGPFSAGGSSLIFISLLLLIAYNNFLGLFPYIFTASSHLTMTLALALPLWLTFMIYGWINFTTHMFAHMVPQSTPSLLMPFMVLIESASNMIRPITLSVRLMANMVAGHLLMTLLGNQTAASSGLTLTTLVVTQILLLSLESAVALIQSYVFAVLTTLYSSEVIAH